MIRLPRLVVDRRPLAAAGVAITVAVVALAIAVVLVVGILDRSSERTATGETLAGLVARSRDHGPRTARIERLVSADPHLPGDTDVLAANALQRHVMAVAADRRLRVRSIVGDDGRSERAGLAIVALRLEIDGRLEDFQRFVYRLETEMPFLLIDSLTLRPIPPGSADGTIGDGVVADLVVVGFRRPKEE